MSEDKSTVKKALDSVRPAVTLEGFYTSDPADPPPPRQSGAADAEIKVLSVENTELKRSPFKAWSRSVYSHT